LEKEEKDRVLPRFNFIILKMASLKMGGKGAHKLVREEMYDDCLGRQTEEKPGFFSN